MKNNRSSYQTARKGWKPRKTSDQQLAQDIADSIRAHAEVGTMKAVVDYTQRPEILALVEKILDKRRITML